MENFVEKGSSVNDSELERNFAVLETAMKDIQEMRQKYNDFSIEMNDKFEHSHPGEAERKEITKKSEEYFQKVFDGYTTAVRAAEMLRDKNNDPGRNEELANIVKTIKEEQVKSEAEANPLRFGEVSDSKH